MYFTLYKQMDPLYDRDECGFSPRGILLLFSLHHVTEARVSQSLCEVGIGSHEAVVVEARAQAGGAQAQRFALGAAGSTQHAFVLRRQVGPKQRLQQLKNKS